MGLWGMVWGWKVRRDIGLQKKIVVGRSNNYRLGNLGD